MNKTCIIREFDLITDNELYKELHSEDSVHLIGRKYYEELKGYIEKVSDKVIDTDEIENFFKIGNHGITAKNYVGLIQLKSGFQLQIMPKLELTDDEKTTENVFMEMLKSLMNYKGRRFSNSDLKTKRMNVFEVFIRMYIDQVMVLIKHGIKSSYVTVEENIPVYKGKLIINEHIKNNAANASRFYMQYDEFLVNRPENRLIKSTLLYLDRITVEETNSRIIKQLLVEFERVDVSTNYQADFAKVSIDRRMNDYFDLIKWSKVFLLNASFTTFAGDTNSLSLLFPMDKLFEAYVAKITKKVFSGDWSVSTQDKGYYLFVEPTEQFSLRPDIVLTNGSRTIIMDTKWKKLIDNQRKNYGISQADMYQMYAYSKKYNTSEIWLLYPINEAMRQYDKLTYDSGDGTTVNVFFIDVAKIEESLKRLKLFIE